MTSGEERRRPTEAADAPLGVTQRLEHGQALVRIDVRSPRAAANGSRAPVGSDTICFEPKLLLRWFTPSVVSLLALCVSVLPAAAQPTQADSAVADVAAKEHALAAATYGGDRSTLDTLLASDFILRGRPDIDRTTWIHNAVTRCWGDRFDIEDLQVRQHGTAIIAAFQLTFYVDPGTCRPAVLRSLITDIWTYQLGAWKLQVRHSGPPPSTGDLAAQYGTVRQVPPLWDVNGELSFVATGGNTSTRTLGAGGTVTHRTDARSTRAAIQFVTSEAESVSQARSLTLQARHGLRVATRTDVFARGTYTRDRFAGIDHRVTAELGVGYTASRGQHAFTTEGGGGFTTEHRRGSPDIRFATATGTVKYVWSIRSGTELSEDIAFTADVQTAPNWRATSATTLGLRLSQLLSLKISHALEYRNAPVVGFGRRDARTAAALVFSWQRHPLPR